MAGKINCYVTILPSCEQMHYLLQAIVKDNRLYVAYLQFNNITSKLTNYTLCNMAYTQYDDRNDLKLCKTISMSQRFKVGVNKEKLRESGRVKENKKFLHEQERTFLI